MQKMPKACPWVAGGASQEALCAACDAWLAPTAESCAAHTVCQGSVQPSLNSRAEGWAWHSPSGEGRVQSPWGRQRKGRAAVRLRKRDALCLLWLVPPAQGWLYWDSWASTDTRIPPWRRHCKASQVQPRLHRSLVGCLGCDCLGMVAGFSLWAGPWCLQQGTGRWALWLCWNPKGINRLSYGLAELRLLLVTPPKKQEIGGPATWNTGASEWSRIHLYRTSTHHIPLKQ